ncbi:MAG: FG-GAP repeat protein [Sedimentisphaerales bacterium]|nr:FG-GAP repeat protein [Sedimentisphaerales bacterium]
MKRTIAILAAGIVVSLLWDTSLLAGSEDAGPGSGNRWSVDFVESDAWRGIKLMPIGGDIGDQFGYSVSISEDYVVVGAPWGPTCAFKRTGEMCIQQAELVASDGAAWWDYFGRSVSVSGDHVIVGAPGDDDNGANSGSAYVFKRSGDAWIEQAELFAYDGAAGDEFGYSVSISGDYAVVGAPCDRQKGYEAGATYVFRRTGDVWVRQAKLVAHDGAAGDNFGYSVSISGDSVLVGALGDDDNGVLSGSAYIFGRTEDWAELWIQRAKLLASDGALGDHFGLSVSISGDRAIIGASGHYGKAVLSGSAYAFRRTGDIWVQQAELLASDGAYGDGFGSSVSVNGGYAVIGAAADDDNGSTSGSAYLFKEDGDVWIQQGKLLASDGASGEAFGCSVSISGDYVVVGAFLDGDQGEESGSAYVFRLSPPTYALTMLVHPLGAGSVSANPLPGPDGEYPADTEVTLTAAPHACHKFTGWSGDLSGLDDTTTIILDGDKMVTANFARITYTLALTSGKGGAVVKPGEGTFSYDCGQSVSIEAEPASAWWHFVGWTGTAVDARKVDKPDNPKTTALVDGDYTVHANFVCEQHTLRVSSTPGGSVCIMVVIDGVAQGWLGDRTLRFDHGTRIELLAVPDPGYAFKNWSGTLWSIDDSVVFTLDQDYTLTANFDPLPTP